LHPELACKICAARRILFQALLKFKVMIDQ
jgi:hypothetical protein